MGSTNDTELRVLGEGVHAFHVHRVEKAVEAHAIRVRWAGVAVHLPRAEPLPHVGEPLGRQREVHAVDKIAQAVGVLDEEPPHPAEPVLEALALCHGDGVDAEGRFEDKKQSGGLVHYLCNLAVADSISIGLKAERNGGALGTPLRANRFEEIVLIGNGTGVAPLYQIANAVLNDPQERTRLRFISAHKSEKDYILGEQIEEWAAASPERFEARVAYSDAGGRRIDADTLSSWLPPPAAPSPRDGGGPAEPPLAIVVCGTDGFLSDVAGPHVRVAVPGESKKRKLPGPIEGHLAALGYSERSCVVLKL